MKNKIFNYEGTRRFALLPMGKKGSEVLIFYWLAILLIVAVGVFAMVYVFYGAPYDVRQVEANLLLNRVADCVSYAGKISTNIISNGNFKEIDFLKECHFVFDAEWEVEQYYAKAEFYKLENTENSVAKITEGNLNLGAGCDIQSGDFRNLPQCAKISIYALDELNNQYIIKILTAVKKTEKNVKI